MSRQIFVPKTKVIDGVTYKVTPFPAVEALKLKAYLLKLLGPAFGRLIGSVRSKGESALDGDINGVELAGALEGLMKQLGEDDFIAFIRRMLQGTSCEIPDDRGKPVMIVFASDFDTKLDLVFQGRLFDIYPVIAFVLEVNFPDFFGKMGGIGSKLKTLISGKLGSASVNESPGSEKSEI
jgi:hypothetical protein